MNVTDQYAYGYRVLANVFAGSLRPLAQGSAAQIGVMYRKVATTRTNVEWAASIGLDAELQTFEIWTVTLTPGYVPGVNDVWSDKDTLAGTALPWNVIKVDADPLVNSVGTPTRYFLLAQRAK